jgi:hypothetical protein
MAYRDDITALSPSHLWRFDTDHNDTVGSLNATNSGFTTFFATGAFDDAFEVSAFDGGAVPSLQITEDAVGSQQSNNITDIVAVPTATTVDQQLSRKAIGGWVRLTKIQQPPCSIYGEGTNSTSLFRFICWAGNQVMLEIDPVGSSPLQIIADRKLQVDREYHLFAVFSGSTFDNTVELFLDGVSQGTLTPNFSALADRDVGEWGEPSSTVSVGGQDISLVAGTHINYAYWAAWGNTTLPSSSEVRTELFEKGSLAGVTIASDTEANMQTALDVLAGSVRPDEPLNIRIEDATGGGEFNLTANNITHDPLASIHVQFVGTGTLNYTNDNGSNTSITSTPNNGTINIFNTVTLTISPLITDSEVRIYKAGTTTEIAGRESSSTSFSADIADNAVDVIVHKEDYEYERFANIDTSTVSTTIRVEQAFDRTYTNA